MSTAALSFLQRRRLLATTAAILAIVFGAALVYWLISDRQYTYLDCIYMTVITITTIGYGEVVDLTHNPPGRIFTMFLALVGIGALTYLLSNITALIIEGNITEKFRRRRMEKLAAELEGHYIVCGMGMVGTHIVRELQSTQRPCVVIDSDKEHLDKIESSFPGAIYLEADGADNDALLAAGIMKAAGVFAATDDDNQNLVISLTARQLNPQITVVARCQDLRNSEKMKAAGANRVISPTFIGGLRMASEMIRPAVVSFLDVMLRDENKNLRIEEIPARLPGKTLRDLELARFDQTLVLAIRSGDGWTYYPKRDHALTGDSVLIVMTTPEERVALQQHLQTA